LWILFFMPQVDGVEVDNIVWFVCVLQKTEQVKLRAEQATAEEACWGLGGYR
jgi:hypothetical protein